MEEIRKYNSAQGNYTDICETLRVLLATGLPEAEARVWHGHPVWFLDGNPIVGYSVQKKGAQLMFWSGRSFDDPVLVGDSRFQDASIFYNSVDEIDEPKISDWLAKSRDIQWDYKNIVKRKGILERLK
ncbi:DUF1801 domain-containing protein [Candidatus Saccharibacteria bacterium]|nr:DUF1801 domain-containing protein [Candidatus Saccharibacteria bacterium]